MAGGSVTSMPDAECNIEEREEARQPECMHEIASVGERWWAIVQSVGQWAERWTDSESRVGLGRTIACRQVCTIHKV